MRDNVDVYRQRPVFNVFAKGDSLFLLIVDNRINFGGGRLRDFKNCSHALENVIAGVKSSFSFWNVG